MQGVQQLTDGGVRLELTASPATRALSLTIDLAESAEKMIERLILENPVIIFSRPACCMCHVMKNLLLTLGVHPAVIELEDDELGALAAHHGGGEGGGAGGGALVVFIGGIRVGGLESLMALHLSGRLVPKLREVGVLWV